MAISLSSYFIRASQQDGIWSWSTASNTEVCWGLLRLMSRGSAAQCAHRTNAFTFPTTPSGQMALWLCTHQTSAKYLASDLPYRCRQCDAGWNRGDIYRWTPPGCWHRGTGSCAVWFDIHRDLKRQRSPGGSAGPISYEQCVLTNPQELCVCYGGIWFKFQLQSRKVHICLSGRIWMCVLNSLSKEGYQPGQDG